MQPTKNSFSKQADQVEFFKNQLASLIGFDLADRKDQIILSRQIEIESEQMNGTKATVLLLKSPRPQDFYINSGRVDKY